MAVEKIPTMLAYAARGLVAFLIFLVMYMSSRPVPQQLALVAVFSCLLGLEALGVFGAWSLFKWMNSIQDSFEELCFKLWMKLRKVIRERGMQRNLDLN